MMAIVKKKIRNLTTKRDHEKEKKEKKKKKKKKTAKRRVGKWTSSKS